jgi:predicted DNA-binding transcriptional regulator AlpA
MNPKLPPQVGVRDAARYLGLATETLRTYASQGTFPPPDGYIGRTPWWWAETVKRWQAERETKRRAR